MTIDVTNAAIFAMLTARRPHATLCPSEVARVIAPRLPGSDASDWRAAMPTVHAAVDQLHKDRRIQLSWKGAELESRSGPYRIALAPAKVAK